MTFLIILTLNMLRLFSSSTLAHIYVCVYVYVEKKIIPCFVLIFYIVLAYIFLEHGAVVSLGSHKSTELYPICFRS